MDKVILTEEQAGRLKKFFLFPKEENVKKHINGWKNKANYCLNDLSLDEFIRVLYVPDSYEVIPEFFEGDWVVTKSGYVGQIEFICVEEDWANIGYSKDTKQRGVCLAKTFNLNEIERYAEEEEIRQAKKGWFWRNLGREVEEWRGGDIVTHNGHFADISVLDIQEEMARFPTYTDCGVRIVPIKEVQMAIPVEQRLDL